MTRRVSDSLKNEIMESSFDIFVTPCFMVKCWIVRVQHSSYSPDLSTA